MTIRFTCSECGSVLKIKDELAGTQARCPKCKTKFVIPAPTSDDQPPEGDAERVESRHSESASLSADEHLTPGAGSTSNGTPVSEKSGQGGDQEKSRSTSAQNSDGSGFESRPKQPIVDRPSSKLTAELSESPTVANRPAPIALGGEAPLSLGDEAPLSLDDEAPLSLGGDAPLSLGDSDDEIDEAPVVFPTKGDQQAASAITSMTSEDDDDLDSPSVFVSSVMTPKSPAETSEKKVEKRRTSSEMPVKDSKPDSSKQDEAFDPMKYLMAEPPKKPRSPFPEPSSRNESDLSLSDDDIDESLGQPTPQPLNRPTPIGMSVRTPPEKVDLATAARMMKKAIKDSQAETSHQREMEANEGYDYFLFLREFGMRGAAFAGGAVVLFVMCLFLGRYIFSSRVVLPPMGYVYGIVTLDGQPLAGATVNFEPMDIKMDGGKRDRARTSIGITDEKGHFKMMYRPAERIEGVAVGKCHVWVSHIGAKGEDVPPEWLFQSAVMREVTKGRQKESADIIMQSRVDPKKK